MESDIINKLADNFVKYNINRSFRDGNEILATAKDLISDIDEQLDKIKFINITVINKKVK